MSTLLVIWMAFLAGWALCLFIWWLSLRKRNEGAKAHTIIKDILRGFVPSIPAPPIGPWKPKGRGVMPLWAAIRGFPPEKEWRDEDR